MMTRESLVEDMELLLSCYPSPFREKVRALCLDDAQTEEIGMLRHERGPKIVADFSVRVAMDLRPEIDFFEAGNAFRPLVWKYEEYDGKEMVLLKEKLKADGDNFRREITKILKDFDLIE